MLQFLIPIILYGASGLFAMAGAQDMVANPPQNRTEVYTAIGAMAAAVAGLFSFIAAYMNRDREDRLKREDREAARFDSMIKAFEDLSREVRSRPCQVMAVPQDDDNSDEIPMRRRR